MRSAFPRSIAVINPLADFGIDTYTHELAQGLAANGVKVDVYAADVSRLQVRSPYANYRRFHVLGSRLPRVLRDEAHGPDASSHTPPTSGTTTDVSRRLPRWMQSARDLFLTVESVIRLKMAHYDVVWTQWPDLGSYSRFWTLARWLRIPVVHTVHNILPHEQREGDFAMSGTAYKTARLLFVHSKEVREELMALFPSCAGRVATIPHGVYTIYERRPAARDNIRKRLNIAPDALVLLACGAIRPYKNVDACIDAVALLRQEDIVLVIAGAEPNATVPDSLPQTRARMQAAQIEDHVRLIPGFVDDVEMAGLFETADVLMLPYLKSYGSGLMMLGITFGKYIVATRPGLEEAASRYSRAILLDSADTAEVARGIGIAAERMRQDPFPAAAPPQEFDWVNIASQCISAIESIAINRVVGRQRPRR